MEPAAARRCDPEAWLDRHGDALFRYALARVRDAAAAEDVVQETFVAALAARDAFRGEAEERTWLTGILRHKIVDHHRKRCRERPLADDGEEADPVVDGLFAGDGHWRRPPGAWQADAAALGERREFWQVFQRCRSALPTRQAAAFTLRLIEGAPAEAVCQELGITATNLWVLLHRARLRLRECLEERWFGKDGR